MRGRLSPAVLQLTALAAAIAVAGCSNPTAGTAAPGTGPIASAVSPGANGGIPSPVGSSDPPVPQSQLTAPPATPQPATPLETTSLTTTTLTVTTTAGPASPPPLPVAPTQPAVPAVPPTDLTGEVHGFITAVDIGAAQITVDKVDWFTGPAAAQACAEDGVTSTDNNRCTGHYFRNVNPMLRVVAVSPQATIVTLADRVHPVTSDLPTLAARVAATRGTNIYDFTITNGVVTDLREIYLP